MKKTKTRPRLLLPDQFHKGPSTIVAPVKLSEGGILKGHVKYILDTWRNEGNWSIDIQWIEMRGNDIVPVVVHLPHQVAEAIARQREAILKESRKSGARKAFETAKHNAREQEASSE